MCRWIYRNAHTPTTFSRCCVFEWTDLSYARLKPTPRSIRERQRECTHTLTHRTISSSYTYSRFLSLRLPTLFFLSPKRIRMIVKSAPVFRCDHNTLTRWLGFWHSVSYHIVRVEESHRHTWRNYSQYKFRFVTCIHTFCALYTHSVQRIIVHNSFLSLPLFLTS